jgi:hypothetical protein
MLFCWTPFVMILEYGSGVGASDDDADLEPSAPPLLEKLKIFVLIGQKIGERLQDTDMPDVEENLAIALRQAEDCVHALSAEGGDVGGWDISTLFRDLEEQVSEVLSMWLSEDKGSVRRKWALALENERNALLRERGFVPPSRRRPAYFKRGKVVGSTADAEKLFKKLCVDIGDQCRGVEKVFPSFHYCLVMRHGWGGGVTCTLESSELRGLSKAIEMDKILGFFLQMRHLRCMHDASDRWEPTTFQQLEDVEKGWCLRVLMGDGHEDCRVRLPSTLPISGWQ